MFPPGAQNQALTDSGIAYTLRYYPDTANYLGVGDADGVVYGLGDFSNQLIVSFGAMTDFSCDVLKTCTRVTPDADGNLGAGFARAADFSLRAGDQVLFEGLGPQDSLIEVNSPALTAAQLCTQASLPAGAAHPVIAQSPMPSGLYPRNELSGPYRTYPAGLYALSTGTDNCGNVERSTPCVAPNEATIAGQVNPAGGTDRLCSVTPYLMNPANPGKPTTSPPTVNPACVRGRVLDSTWADPAVQGVFLRLSWSDIQPAYASYDWTALDRELMQAVRYGKTVTIGIRVGGNSIPDWVFSTGSPSLGAAKPVNLRDWDTGPDALPNANCGFQYVVASPSDPAFKALFKKAIADMAAHIRADQRKFSVLAGVKITGMGMATLENRLPKRCNIAVRNPALGDTGTQGHIISVDSRSRAAPVFDPQFNLAADPGVGRIKDVSQCVCNPQVLQYAGYRPSAVQTFYSEVEATLRQNFGYKQMTFMNISDGFPQIGESGRFLGDHLTPPIISVSTNASGQPVISYGALQARPAQVPADIPGGSDTTRALLLDGRNGVFAGGDLGAARGFGVENAALSQIGFAYRPNSGLRCSQQVGIDLSGTFAGSATFPIAAGAPVDASTPGCPNWLATKEGVAYDKAGGFQVGNDLSGASEIDGALWNLTLNTNGLFMELYESDAWLARKQSALNAGSVLNPAPAVMTELATLNHAAASAKSGVDWNTLLRARAAAFSADARHDNLYQSNPFPSAYAVNVESAPGSVRYLFNARACQAYYDRGVPLRVNRISILN